MVGSSIPPSRTIRYSMISLKPIRQSASFCGPASLVSLVQYYGKNMTEPELGRLCGTTTENGTEPEALAKGLKKLGFKVKTKDKGTWNELKTLVDSDTPVLVNWWSDYGAPADGHYSVVYKMTGRTLWMMDPELGGFRRMTKAKFMRQWYDFYINGKKNTRWYLYIQG
ncbi:MAG: hypothetical protein JWN89_551 [Parcubacteria group bacterium]|nr:hypothetical protein [Parcubacteria group bacterium]